ncbi:hypothetical protein L249_5820 [Ophiocordyceps polyrhachis-furcata BCC 54312]|uniref:Uncharacterized protein n=1 Tax=Ophiocordyceps polyrhachis-furcata BCC 54312 TaxID=1330021 RepID=A0A367L061_9HYPO|nr:hypothetical protein L249_5820 [Ophiocordyceps polyrhachis-furcata BCC 54312]
MEMKMKMEMERQQGRARVKARWVFGEREREGKWTSCIANVRIASGGSRRVEAANRIYRA